jgi:drug/metabolite transporter (DMT)-like permease
MSIEKKGAFLTLLGGVCWGLSGSCGQFLFRSEGMTTNWLVPIRLGLAGIILLVYSFYKYGKETLEPWRTSRDRIDLIIYGILGVSCCQYLYFLTIQLSSAGIATIMQDLSPVMVLMVSCIIARRIPRSNEILSVVLALIGVVLITTHGSLNSFAIPTSAILTGVVSAVCVTIYNMEPVKLLKKYPVSILQGWAFLLGSVMFNLLFQPWKISYTPNLSGILGIAFVVIIGNVVAFTTYMSGVRLIGAEKAILYGFAEPVTAAIITACFMGSPFTIYDALGFAAIFGMLALISFNSPEKSPAEAVTQKVRHHNGLFAGGK